jgi:hypothetical protein
MPARNEPSGTGSSHRPSDGRMRDSEARCLSLIATGPGDSRAPSFFPKLNKQHFETRCRKRATTRLRVWAELGCRDPDIASHQQEDAGLEAPTWRSLLPARRLELPRNSARTCLLVWRRITANASSKVQPRAGHSNLSRPSRDLDVAADLSRVPARQCRRPLERLSPDASINPSIRVHELPSGWLCE